MRSALRADIDKLVAIDVHVHAERNDEVRPLVLKENAAKLLGLTGD